MKRYCARIGLLIGFCAALPFWALDMAGFLIDTLRGSSMELRESILSSIGARQRRMIDSDLAAGDQGNPREVAIARRSITQEAIRLAAAGQIQLKEKVEEAQAA